MNINFPNCGVDIYLNVGGAERGGGEVSVDIYSCNFRRVPHVYCAIMLCMRLRLVMSLVGRFIAYYVPALVSALSALSVSAARGDSFTFLLTAHRASTARTASTVSTART